MAIESNVTKSTGIISSGLKSLKIGQGESVGGGGTISCAYPMDMTEAALQGYGFTGRLALSNNDQTGTRTITAGSGVWAMASEALTTIDASAGIVAVQMDVDVFDAITASGSAALEILFYSGALSPIYGVSVVATSSGWQITTGTYTGSVEGSPPSEIGVTFNANTSEISLKVDGAVLETPSYTPQTVIPIMDVTQNATQAGDAGNIVTGTFVTVASSITQAVGAASDPCGNSI